MKTMKHNTERPIYEILAELRNHPDIVRLEWVTKQSIKEEFELKCEMQDIEPDFDEFWKKKEKEIKEDSHYIFTYNEYYTSEIIDEYLVD